MTKTMLLLIAMMVISFGCGKKVNEDKSPEVITPEITSDRYLEYVNSHRIKLGLNPLESTEIIVDQALEHSRAMAGKKRPFGHYGTSVRCKKIRDFYGYKADCGEIVALGPKTAREVFDMWMSSSSHRQIIEGGHFTHTGFGFERDLEGNMYWTQIFYAHP